MKSLANVEEMIGINRRKIQEYEKAGLATKPECKNKYGHLRYGFDEIERLWQIRFYRELGYDKNKIRKISEISGRDKEKEIQKTLEGLIEERERLDNLIAIMQMEKKYGIRFDAYESVHSIFESPHFDELLKVVGNVVRSISPLAQYDYAPGKI